MIKNLYYSVYACHIDQKYTSDSVKKKKEKHSLKQIYLINCICFPTSQLVRTLVWTWIWFSLESMAPSCPSCFIFFSSPNHFITITLPALLFYSIYLNASTSEIPPCSAVGLRCTFKSHLRYICQEERGWQKKIILKLSLFHYLTILCEN